MTAYEKPETFMCVCVCVCRCVKTNFQESVFVLRKYLYKSCAFPK